MTIPVHRILMVLPAEYPNGGAQALRFQYIADGLACAGWDVRVIGLASTTRKDKVHGDGLAVERDRNGIAFRNVNPRGSNKNNAMAIAAEEEYERMPYSVIFCYGPFWNPIKKVVEFGKSKRCFVIADCTEYYEFRPWRIFNKSYWDHVNFRRKVATIDGVTAISQFYSDYANRLGVKTFVLPALCSHHLLSTTSVKAKWSGVLKLTYVGALSTRNRIGSILRAVSKLSSDGVRVELHCFGHSKNGKQSRWIKHVDQCDLLRKTVFFHGRIKGHADLLERLRTCHAAILLRDTSKASIACFPTRIPEFLSLGLPVITSASGDIGMYLEHMKSAILLNPKSEISELVQAVEAMSSSSELLERLSENGREVASQRFENRQLGRSLSNWLKRMVGEKSADPSAAARELKNWR